MFFIAYIIFAVTIVLVASIFSPLGQRIGTNFYNAGGVMMSQALLSSNEISNATIKTTVQADIQGAINKKTANIDLITNYFKYSWVILLLVTVMGLFITTRKYSVQGGFL